MDQKRYDIMLSELYKFTVPLVRPHQVMAYINSGKKVLFFDIRSEKEFKISHIPDALFFNYDEFNALI